MSNDIATAVLPLVGVVIGALLTFTTQYLLQRQQEKVEVRKKAIDVKNEQCLVLWKVISETYQYLFFAGRYSEEKIDVRRLGEHIKALNVAIIKAEPFISHQSFLRLMEVRNAVNLFFGELEATGSCSYDEHMAFIARLEEPLNKARDVLREELHLTELRVVGKRPNTGLQPTLLRCAPRRA